MHDFLKEWENILPQYYKLRVDKLLNLQSLSEIYVKFIYNLLLIKILYENYYFSILQHQFRPMIIQKQL